MLNLRIYIHKYTYAIYKVCIYNCVSILYIVYTYMYISVPNRLCLYLPEFLLSKPFSQISLSLSLALSLTLELCIVSLGCVYIYLGSEGSRIYVLLISTSGISRIPRLHEWNGVNMYTDHAQLAYLIFRDDHNRFLYYT